jgi:hypothetical protein
VAPKNAEAFPLPDYIQIVMENPGFFDEAVSTEEAARITGRPVSSLETLRCRGNGPPFVQHGRRVTYRRRDLYAWLAAGVRRSTSGANARMQQKDSNRHSGGAEDKVS